MKSLIAILLIISFNATSQEVRDPGFTQKNPIWKYESVEIHQPILNVTMPRYNREDSAGHRPIISDTVKVIMLVNDSSYLSSSFCIYGFLVIQKQKSEMQWDSNMQEISRLYLYLNKQPLKPSIIVWQSIQIK